MNSSNGTFLSKNPFSDKPIRCNDGFIKAQMDNLTVCSKSRDGRDMRGIGRSAALQNLAR